MPLAFKAKLIFAPDQSLHLLAVLRLSCTVQAILCTFYRNARVLLM